MREVRGSIPLISTTTTNDGDRRGPRAAKVLRCAALGSAWAKERDQLGANNCCVASRQACARQCDVNDLRRFRMQSHAQSAHDFKHGCKTGIAVAAKSFVEAFA